MSFEKRSNEKIQSMYKKYNFHKLGEGEDWKLSKMVQVEEEDGEYTTFNIWYLFDLSFGRFKFYLTCVPEYDNRVGVKKNIEGEIIEGVSIQFDSCKLTVLQNGTMKVVSESTSMTTKIPLMMANDFIGENGTGTTN